MDVNKLKLAGLRGAFGQPTNKKTMDTIREHISGTLEHLTDTGMLDSGSQVGKVQTKHKGKKFFGRVREFFLWKTPLRRWLMANCLNGKMWVDIERKGQPSRWVTLHALRVLRRLG